MESCLVDEFLSKYWTVPWVRGEHDCIAFAIKYAKECFDVDLSDKQLQDYSDLRTAKRAYIRACLKHKVKSFNEYLDKKLSFTLGPADGCVVAKPDLEGLVGHSYGVVKGGYGFFVDTDGIIPIKLDPKLDLYWKVI